MKIYSSLIDRLKSQHLAIENMLAGIDNDRLQIRPLPDKWNIHDNLAHLTSYQPVFIQRINQMLLENAPSFGRYNAPDDPAFQHCRILTVDQLIKQLNADRQSIYELLTNLPGTQLERIGIHKKYGPLNIIQWTEFFLLHEAHHLFTIFQLAHDIAL